MKVSYLLNYYKRGISLTLCYVHIKLDQTESEKWESMSKKHDLSDISAGHTFCNVIMTYLLYTSLENWMSK